MDGIMGEKHLTDIFTSRDAAKYCGEELLFSPSPQDRLWAARTLGRYDAGGYLVQNALLPGLQDRSPEVRIEVYKGLARMHYSLIEDLMPVARAIQETMELEEVESPSWYAGKRSLEKLSLQADELAMEYRNGLQI